MRKTHMIKGIFLVLLAVGGMAIGGDNEGGGMKKYNPLTPEEEAACQKVRDALKANGKKKVVVAGLWTEVCNNSFALCAMLEGDYEIYMVADASGGTSKEAHDYAMQRMIQAGVIPVTWQQVMLEWQRDWARKETYTAVMDIVREHSGAYGTGVDYAYTMVHKAPSRQKSEHRTLAPVPAR